MVKLNIGRFLVGLVLVINLHCALSFLFEPDQYAPAYELVGSPGEAAVKGFGVLFLMWNIPYIIAFIHPVKYRISLFEAIAMQSLGLLGETFIISSISPAHTILFNSILRFIFFDAAGLICLVIAAIYLRNR